MGSRSYQVIMFLVMGILILPSYSADHGTRGAGGEEDPIPEEGPSPDGYYNLTRIDPLLNSPPEMVQMIDGSMDLHLAFSKLESGTPSSIYYSKHSSDLDPLVSWRKVVQGNYLVPVAMGYYLNLVSGYFIEWRHQEQTGSYYPDLKMISIDRDSNPVTEKLTLITNLSLPQTLEDLFDYHFMTRFQISVLPDGRAHVIHYDGSRVRYDVFHPDGEWMRGANDPFRMFSINWWENIHSWGYEPNHFHVVCKNRDGWTKKVLISTYPYGGMSTSSMTLNKHWDRVSVRHYPEGFRILAYHNLQSYHYYLNKGTEDERFQDPRISWDLISSNGEKFYMINRPQCNHGGTSKMWILEKDRNGTYIRESPWLRFLADGQFEQYDVCHDVMIMDWNQIIDGSFTMLLRLNYFAGSCFILLKVNEDLEMDGFKVILPMEVTDIESEYDDMTSGNPTTGEMYRFAISNISSDLLAYEIKVEVDLNGIAALWSSLIGDNTKEAEIQVPFWSSGTMTYRFHFIDPFGLEFVTSWKYKIVTDNDFPHLHLPEIKWFIECGSTLVMDIKADDNVGLGSVKAHYSLGDSDAEFEELLLTGDHEDKTPDVPVSSAKLRWELKIPETEMGPLQYWFSVEDNSGLEWTSAVYNITVIDKIAPTILRADKLTVMANETFEHVIMVTDNWEVASYDWNENPLDCEGNQFSGMISTPGLHRMNVKVFDNSGNSISVAFIIEVLPEPVIQIPLPTGVNINDTGSDIISDPVQNGSGSGYKPHYWGEPVNEIEDEENEKNQGRKATVAEITSVIFIGALMLVASFIALLFAYSIKIQQEDIIGEE